MKIKKVRLLLALACALMLLGCEKEEPVTVDAVPEVVETEPTVPATVPEDGKSDDVTCKGVYTVEGETFDQDAVVATVGDKKLTNGQLAVWYHSTVAQYRREGHETEPNYGKDLTVQSCGIDDSVRSWQQYFLREALNRWHQAQALEIASRTEPLVKEATYQPQEGLVEKYMSTMPVTDILYGYNDYFQPNSMHQAYLDGIPEMLETLAKDKGYADGKTMAAEAFGTDLKSLTEAAALDNYGYMYFTQLGYADAAEPAAAEAEKKDKTKEPEETTPLPVVEGERYVDIRHVLLVPKALTDKKGNVLDGVSVSEDGIVSCSEAVWEANAAKAEKLLKEWNRNTKNLEKEFREIAYYHSDERSSAENGGIYRQLRQGSLMPELDEWCFDESRQVGDVTTIRTEYGHHILYFAGCVSAESAETARKNAGREKETLIGEIQKRYPVEIDYTRIQLPRADAAVAAGELLYPDVAHERYPEVPLYLQQCYNGVKFGHDPLRTHGCGITTFSMLSSYMADEEHTPPEMCARFGRYSYGSGTDGMLYNNEPATLGYYMLEKTYEPKRVREALAEGHIVISIQHPGYWTRGGHYILLEKQLEDGTVQVRDSNVYNYVRVKQHAQDKHELQNIFASGSGYWIIQKKVTRIPFCSRCGEGSDTSEILLAQDYLCEKCENALVRRNAWLGNAE